MARHKFMRARVENWAQWRQRRVDGIGRYASVNLMDPTPKTTEPYADAPIRPDEQDAGQVDVALRSIALPSELRATLECHYLGRYTEAEKLRRLNISKTTLHDRLDRIDYMLVRYFSDQHAQRVREREVIQAVQASVRPA